MNNFYGLLLILAVCLLSYRAYEIGEVLRDAHEARERERTEVQARKCRLPCICRRYINLGTDEWIECMQVGKK